ncbi:glycosyltransferase, partial [candidate division KSB1 bacterium]
MKSTVETNYNLELSLIIPLYNEEDNVKPLYLSIKKVVEKLRKSYEIIFIDDGSTDKTFTLLEKISREDKHIKIIKFRGNFGQSAAMAAGFEAAQGKVVISMDGDLQNDPQDIPNL